MAQACAVLWALPRLLRPKAAPPGWCVPHRWTSQHAHLLYDLADQIADGLQELAGADLVDAAVGLAELGLFPGEGWMDAHERAANARLGELGAEQFEQVRWGRAIAPAGPGMARARQAEGPTWAGPGISKPRPGPGRQEGWSRRPALLSPCTGACKPRALNHYLLPWLLCRSLPHTSRWSSWPRRRSGSGRWRRRRARCPTTGYGHNGGHSMAARAAVAALILCNSHTIDLASIQSVAMGEKGHHSVGHVRHEAVCCVHAA